MIKRAVMLASFASLVTFGLTACDADGDGLSNAEEKDLGFDPKNPDMDGDGLVDGEDPNPQEVDADGDRLDDLGEIEHKTDPNNPDTDGDGYLDGDEVFEGSDPADPKSKIYKGGWPYNYDKDSISGKKSDTIQVGKRMPRFELKDQFGDRVDLYDFAGHGKEVIVDLSALNCGPCLTTGEWLDSGENLNGLEDAFGDLRKAINKGDVYWLTFVYTSYGSPSASSRDVVEDWEDQFPNKKIVLLADDDMEAWDWAYQGGMPFFAHLNDQLVVQSFEMGIWAQTQPLVDAQNNL